jgi:hypothetical protein
MLFPDRTAPGSGQDQSEMQVPMPGIVIEPVMDRQEEDTPSIHPYPMHQGDQDRLVEYGKAGAVIRVRYCGAKTRAGGTCKMPAMSNGRCRMHGGKTPRGYASANFKHGKYSKYLPANLQKQYEASLKDSDLLSLVNELALVDSRLAELIKKLDTKESGRLWLKANEVFREMVVALRESRLRDVNSQMARLSEILEKGQDEYGVWHDIGEQMDRRRALADAERRRMVDAQYMVDVEKAKTLMAALAASVRKHVTDTKILAAISEDFLRLTQGSDGRTNKSD